jgi:membrane protease YdiL (CAAX protease family)
MWLLRFGATWLPEGLAREFTVESYSIAVQVVTVAIGLALSFSCLDAPRPMLGLYALSSRAWLCSLLLAPAAYVVIGYAAVGLAWSTLQQEVASGGVALVRSQGGSVVAAMTRPSWFTPLLWAVVVSPIAEELLFRGALWSSVQGPLARIVNCPPRVRPEDTIPLEPNLLAQAFRWLIASGTLTTLVTATLFAALHADLKGSQGIVRVTSAAGLALVCGVARQRTGSVAGAVFIHMWLNAFGLASARRWLVTESFPKYYTVPTLISLFGGLGLVAALVIGFRYATNRRSVA